MSAHHDITDPFLAELHDVLVAATDHELERADLQRIRGSWLVAGDAPSEVVAPGPARGAVRRRSRARVLVVAALVALLVAVVGAAAASETVRRFFTRSTPSAQRMHAFSITGSPSGVAGAPGADVPAAAQQQLDGLYARDEAFRRPLPGSPGADDPVTTPSMRERYGELAPASQTRTLLTGRWNGRAVGVYARATSTGAVCYVDFVAGSGESASACFASYFDLDAPVAVNGTRRTDARGATHLVLFGLAADEVVGVSVRLADGTTSDALLGTNAFYWDATTSTAAPQSLDVELSSGEVVNRPLLTNPSAVSARVARASRRPGRAGRSASG